MVYHIGFWYEHYCQGYETAYKEVVVETYSFEEAVNMIKGTGDYSDANNFKDLTIRKE